MKKLPCGKPRRRSTRCFWIVRQSSSRRRPRICRACRIYDQYARGKYPENWYADDRWTSTLTTAKDEAYVRKQLAPVLSGYALHRTVSYSYPTLNYRNPRNEWVMVDFYKGGFT